MYILTAVAAPLGLVARYGRLYYLRILNSAALQLRSQPRPDHSMPERAAFHRGHRHDAEPAIGQKDFLGVDDVLAPKAALFDFAAGDDPFANDAGAAATASRRRANTIVADDEDIGATGGDNFGAIVEENRLVELAAADLGECVAVEPIVGSLQSTEDRLVSFFMQADFPRVVGTGRCTQFDEDENARLLSRRGGAAITGGDVDAGEAGDGLGGRLRFGRR